MAAVVGQRAVKHEWGVLSTATVMLIIWYSMEYVRMVRYMVPVTVRGYCIWPVRQVVRQLFVTF